MNSVIIIGNLTRDPEVRYTQNRMAVCHMTVAVNDRVKNPNTGEYEDRPSFIPVVVWGKQAENCERFLNKGSKVAVNGRIKTGSYNKQDGTRVYTTDVIANSVEFLSHQETVQRNQDETQNWSQPRQNDVPRGFDELAQQESIPF